LSLHIKESAENAKTCVIWLHGLGADAADMMDLVNRLALPSLSLRHVFMDAPTRPITINGGMAMRAWYDVVGMSLTAREDEKGIKDSHAKISAVIAAQNQAGFAYERIFLAGFSQGGAMALYTGLHSEISIGGVMALSAYLPLATSCKPSLHKNTPIFMASGYADMVVLPLWTQLAKDWIQNIGYTDVTWRQYPMGHAICLEEMKDIAIWLTQHVEREEKNA
jgi:phospholipase/carboxylesterase